MDLRSKHKDAFLKNHGLKLGFMSAFTKAASYALQSMPVVNAGELVLPSSLKISLAYSGACHPTKALCFKSLKDHILTPRKL